MSVQIANEKIWGSLVAVSTDLPLSLGILNAPGWEGATAQLPLMMINGPQEAHRGDQLVWSSSVCPCHTECHGAPRRPLPLTLSLSGYPFELERVCPSPFLLRVALPAAFLALLILLISIFHHFLFPPGPSESFDSSLGSGELKTSEYWFYICSSTSQKRHSSPF